MPEFKADIKVQAIADSSLNTIDQKIESWKKGVQSAVSFTASGLDDIEKRIRDLQNTKINLGFTGSGVGGGTGGGNGGGGARGRNSIPRVLTQAKDAAKKIARYNAQAARLEDGAEKNLARRYQRIEESNLRHIQAMSKYKAGNKKGQYDTAINDILGAGQQKADLAVARKQDLAVRKANREAIAGRKKDFNQMLGVQKEYDKLYAQHGVTDASTEAYKAQEDQLKNLYNTRKGMMSQLGTFSQAEQHAYQRTVANGKALQQQVKFQRDLKDAMEIDRKNVALTDFQRQSAGLDFDIWKNQNGRARKAYADQIKDVENKIKNAKTVGERESANEEFQLLQKQIIKDNKGGMTFGQRLKSSMADLASYISPMMVVGYAKQAVQAMYQNVEQIDVGMTELRKVTNNSEQEYKQFRQNAKKTAINVGTTQKELINSSADWARLNTTGLPYGDVWV